MAGQEGKTALQLQIDIPANVFVCCEKWCRNSHLHSKPTPPPATHPTLFGLSLSLVLLGFSLCSESYPAIHFEHPELHSSFPSILTAPDHSPGFPAFHSHCIPGLHFLVAIETLPQFIVQHLSSFIPFFCCAPPGSALRPTDQSGLSVVSYCSSSWEGMKEKVKVLQRDRDYSLIELVKEPQSLGKQCYTESLNTNFLKYDLKQLL